MDVPTLTTFLRPILTVTTVLNTGETGDMNSSATLASPAKNNLLYIKMYLHMSLIEFFIFSRTKISTFLKSIKEEESLNHFFYTRHFVIDI